MTLAGRRTGQLNRADAEALDASALAAIRATARLPRTAGNGRTETQEQARKRGDVDIAIAPVMRNVRCQYSSWFPLLGSRNLLFC